MKNTPIKVINTQAATKGAAKPGFLNIPKPKEVQKTVKNPAAAGGNRRMGLQDQGTTRKTSVASKPAWRGTASPKLGSCNCGGAGLD